MRAMVLLLGLSGCMAVSRVQHRDTARAVDVDLALMGGSVALCGDSVMRTDSHEEFLVGFGLGAVVWTADVITELVMR